MILQRELSRIANDLAVAGGRRVPETVIERDYCLAWWLSVLAKHRLRDVLAFKGGTALRRCYFADYRFSEDLDFTLVQPTPFDVIRQAINEIGDALQQESGILMTFDRMDRKPHERAHTFYLKYQGPLPAPNDVKVDITITEALVFPLAAQPVLRSYAAYTDLPVDRHIHVYTLDEIAVEKIVALGDPARTEPRDLYDLWYLTTTANINFGMLASALEAKLRFRQRSRDTLFPSIAKKKERLERLWSVRLENQMIALPHFAGVFREVRRALKALE